MRIEIITTCFVLALFNVACSQVTNEKYLLAMKTNIDEIHAADSIPEYQSVVNAFQRIAAVEVGAWEPRYYAAFGFIMMATLSTDAVQKDGFLDQAMTELAKAREALTEESEIEALEGFAYMLRVTVDPATRGPQMAPLAMKHYHKALYLNPENPRAVALLAQMEYGTAQFFGSSVDEACSRAKKAFDKFKSFTSPNPLSPRWGMGMAESLAKKCQ